MTLVESVTAQLADEPRPLGVLVSVAQTLAGEVQVRLHTDSPYHQTAFVVRDGERNVEQLYLNALRTHQRAVANLGGKGAA